ncbi:MAG: hypothetical protein ACE5G0_17890 [Rhodothermales bacterium]
MHRQTNDENAPSRRRFMRLAATLFGAVSVAGGSILAYPQRRSSGFRNGSTVRLNPAFRIRERSPKTIELYTRLGDGRLLKHRFDGLEADLFRQIEEGQPAESLVASLAQKHDLSVAACRTITGASLQEFEEAGLVYYGDKMLVKIVEATHG